MAQAFHPLAGWTSGRSIPRLKTRSPSACFLVRSMNEAFSLEREAAQAYALKLSGKARFRAVLAAGH